MKFEQALQAGGLVVEYHAFDLHPQHPRVRPFDANTQPLPAHFDLLVMLGVTEYLSDLPASLARFAPATRLGLFSHVVSELSSHQPGRIAELGWRNHLSSGEFESVCERSGWQAVDSVLTANGRTRIWLLRGRGANAGP
ncbi:MAG: hypothetical protein R3E87_24215 [Burkholderiaceae bacterium]